MKISLLNMAFLRGHAHMTTPSCRKILCLAPAPKISIYATGYHFVENCTVYN